MKFYALILLTAMACSKHHSKSGSAALPQIKSEATPVEQVETPVKLNEEKVASNVPDDFVLREDFKSASLLLVYPSAENFGMVQFEGEDAKLIYDSLAVNESRSGSEFKTQKEGKNITCFKTHGQSEKISDRYVCSFYFDYHSGRADLVNAEELNGLDGQKKELRINGDDAKVLYLVMEQEEISSEKDVNRKVSDLACSHELRTNKFWCSVSLNLKNGEVFKEI